MLQRQSALDRFIARQCAPGRESAIELRVGKPRPHVCMPAFALLAVDGQKGDVQSLAHGRRAAEQMRSGRYVRMQGRDRFEQLGQVGIAVGPLLLDEPAEQGAARRIDLDRKSTRLNSSHLKLSRMPSSA